ncbi:MAG: hypothetical protein ABIO70_07870 [Pseudomonadota bacterium]
MIASSLVALILAIPGARAAELEWAGHYRARGLLYDSLSLSDTNPQAEGTSNLLDHRLRLEPRFHITERVGIFAQLDALSLVPWGEQPEAWQDPVTGDTTYLAYDQTLVAPTSTDGGAAPASVAITRAWGEVYTDIGQVRFGRVPLHWGAGIWENAGLGADDEYGDTADRVQFTSRIGLIYLMAAYDVNYEGYLNVPDDMQSANLAVSYQTESLGLGFHNQYRWQPSQDLSLYTGDLWLKAELGPAEIEAEAVGVFGSGNLGGGINDVRIASVGAMLRGEATFDKLVVGAELGLATGDGDPTDSTIKTFTFDRDHNVSLLMFEEPLPTLEATTANENNGGRDYDAVRTGEGIRNALYLRPQVGYRFLPTLRADLAVFGAQAAKLPEAQSDDKGYGWEIDATVTYAPYEHFQLRGMAGVMFPGRYYSSYEDTELGGGFDKPAIGGLLQGTVSF